MKRRTDQVNLRARKNSNRENHRIWSNWNRRLWFVWRDVSGWVM